MFNLDTIRKNFPKWNKKTAISIGNNRQYKVIGCGAKAFKVLKFEPQRELNNQGAWSQVFWNYSQIPKDSEAEKVIEKLESLM